MIQLYFIDYYDEWEREKSTKMRSLIIWNTLKRLFKMILSSRLFKQNESVYITQNMLYYTTILSFSVCYECNITSDLTSFMIKI